MSISGYGEVKLRDGRTLAYAEHGSPSGQPVIYCHAPCAAVARAQANGWRLGRRNPIESCCNAVEIREGFMACFEEACRQGPRGPALDMGLIARPWGFDLAAVNVPVLLWHGERDRNVPVASGRYLASALPHYRATFYAEDAHLSVPLNHQEEIFGALATALAAA